MDFEKCILYRISNHKNVAQNWISKKFFYRVSICYYDRISVGYAHWICTNTVNSLHGLMIHMKLYL